MRITGYTHNLTEFLRLYVADHLTYELGTAFRDTEGADSTVNLLRRNAERACILEDTHRFLIAHRNLLGIEVRIHILLQIFFQHLQNHRIIVAQNIQLNQTVIDAVIIVVSSNRSAILIIGRTVHRRNIMDIHITRHNHDAAGMLASSALDAGKAFNQRSHMRRMHMQILALIIFSDKAYRRFISNGCNRTGTANVIAAEKLLGVLVRYALVGHGGRIIGIDTTGEVQINIRNLIAVEAQENRKRDIMTVAQHSGAAFGTILRRQVKAAVDLIVHKEFAVTAVRTAIMRFQRINLGNIQHRSNKGRAYAATRAYQVTAVDRMLNQLMRNVIQYGEAVADNRIQFHLQAVLNNLRQLFAVPFMRLSIGQIAHGILGTGNRRRIQLVAVGNRLNAFNHIRNLIGIRNNNLVGCLLAQIRELLEHLLRSMQVQRRLQIRILVALTGLQNRTQLCILRIEEMHVAGCYSQLAQAFAKLVDFAVMLAQILLRAVIFAYQKLIIARRLNFQIIIKAGDFLQLLIART